MNERRGASYHAALASASASRKQVFDLLAVATRALDAQSIAEAVGRHVTTVRFHLDQLVAVGLIHRETETSARRGRPRLLFAVTAADDREENSREQLIEALASALGDGESDRGRGRALLAGRQWARSVIPSALGGSAADEKGRREILLNVLDELGFEPSLEDDTIQLLACPFRDAARAHPQVVCSVHSGLVQEILQTSDAPGEVRLLPFVQSDLCAIAQV